MGLEEKRWAKSKREKDGPAFVAQIQAITGTKAAVDIDWDAFSENLEEVGYISDDQYGLNNLLRALTSICGDDLGKDAIKDSLKKVVVKPAKSAETKFAFEGGIISWNAYFGSKSEGYIYTDAMKKALESKL